jgi:energy-converting hydrogenase A subunit M
MPKLITEEKLKEQKSQLENQLKEINNMLYERHFRTIGVR